MKLAINFHPESDREELVQAASEYEKIWEVDGERIVNTWEKHTGLGFQESSIDAKVFDGMSYSHPLSLRYSLTPDQKEYVLVHELGHRILYKRVVGMGDVTSLERHKFLFLVLGAIIKELYGDAFLVEAIAHESNLAPKYKTAWEWVLKFSEVERQRLFKEVLNGNLSVITGEKV